MHESWKNALNPATACVTVNCSGRERGLCEDNQNWTNRYSCV